MFMGVMKEEGFGVVSPGLKFSFFGVVNPDLQIAPKRESWE